MAKNETIFRKGPMKLEDALCIQKSSAYIEYHVDGKDLTAKLYLDLVIDSDDKESVESGKTRKYRIKTLLNILRNRGPNAYSGLLAALRTNGYEGVANVIEEKKKRTQKTDVNTRLGKLKTQVAFHGTAIDIHDKKIVQQDCDIGDLGKKMDTTVSKNHVVKLKKDIEVLAIAHNPTKKIKLKIQEKEHFLQQLQDDFAGEELKLKSRIEDSQKQRAEREMEIHRQKIDELTKKFELQDKMHEELKGFMADMKQEFMEKIEKLTIQKSTKKNRDRTRATTIEEMIPSVGQNRSKTEQNSMVTNNIDII